jgi:transcription initiation factor TFIID subunit 11
MAPLMIGLVFISALDVCENNKETGPLRPKHIREAVRKLKAQSAITNNKYQKKFKFT